MKTKQPNTGMNRREYLRLAEKLGCWIVPIKATGELRIGHPAWERTIRVNNRRHHVPKTAIALLASICPLVMAQEVGLRDQAR